MIGLKDRFPEAVSPTDWGAIVNYDEKVWRPWNENKFIVHWGGTPVSTSAAAGDPLGEEAQIRSWERYHVITKGWRGIAYNWAIGNSGQLYRLRGDNANGATSGDYELNGVDEFDEGVAVVFIIGTGQSPSPAALNTFQDMYARVPELELVIGHRDVWLNSGTGSNTTCPGDELWDWIQADGHKGEAMIANGLAAAELQRDLIALGYDLGTFTPYSGPFPSWYTGNTVFPPGADGDPGSKTTVAAASFAAAVGCSSTLTEGFAALVAGYARTSGADHNHDGEYAKVNHGHTLGKYVKKTELAGLMEDHITVDKAVVLQPYIDSSTGKADVRRAVVIRAVEIDGVDQGT